MKETKNYRIVLAVVFFLAFVIGTGGDAKAESVGEPLDSGMVELTEENHYDPRYYQPIDSTGEVCILSDTDEAEAGDSFAETVKEALQNRETRIDVSRFGLTVGEVSEQYFSVLNNYMELFFVADSFSYAPLGSKVISIIPSYALDEQETQRIQNIIDDVTDEALSLVTEEMEDYEKALVIHDWLATYCEYDYDNYLTNTISDASHSLYGPFINRAAVCDGYAKAYKYIMQNKLGIPCYLTPSDAMNHAWNIIQIDGSFYHVDVTWDDPVRDIIGRVSHENFLLSDTAFKAAGYSGWETTLEADDTTYDGDVLWKNSNGSIIYYLGKWYFVDNGQGQLMKTDNIVQGETEALYSFDKWRTASGGSWKGTYSYPQIYHDKLIFNSPKEIYRMSLKTEEITTEYVPAEATAAGENIYGFYLDGTTMYYAVQSSPNLSSSQKEFIKEYELQKDPISGTLTLEGEERYRSTLTAGLQMEPGIVGKVSYSWYRDGVQIAGETGTAYTLTEEDIGKKISVKAVHPEYDGELMAQTGTICKGQPVSPSLSLQGEYGEMLSSIELPEGYTWVNPTLVMEEQGRHSYAAIYCPDPMIYDPIEISVIVDVVVELCEEHQWGDGVVAKEPTESEEGIMTYTCRICGTTKLEKIEALGPADPTPGPDPDKNPDPDQNPNPDSNTEKEPGKEDGSGSNNNSGNTSGDKTGGNGGDTNEIPVTQIQTNAVPEKGTVLKVSGTSYKVTKKGTEKKGTGTVEVTGSSSKTVVIPKTITMDGITYKVTAIASKAFKGKKAIKKVTIGANVEKIGSEAFSGCKNLKTINIKSKRLKSVGKKAIKGIHKKAVIKCPAKMKKKNKKLFTAKTGYKKSMKIK